MNGKKILSLILCLVMCLSMFPTWAFAEEAQAEEPAEAVEEPTETEVPEEETDSVVLETPEESEPVSEEAQKAPASDVAADDADKSAEAPLTEEQEESVTGETATQPVTVRFLLTPEEALLTVYTKDEQGEKEIIDPEEDESYLLLPGEYFYTLEAEGFVTIEETAFTVEAAKEPVELELTMDAEPVPEVQETESVKEKAEIEAEEELSVFQETAGLLSTTASGSCGGNLTWTLDDAGVLTISGTGSMTDYSGSYYIPWYNYRSQLKTVVLERGVTSIGNYAFSNCSSLTDITIPASVTKIGNYAFQYCKLTSIAIPTSVSSIGSSAFSSSLTDVYYAGSNAQWNQIEFGGSNYVLTMADIHYAGGIVSLSGTCGDALSWTLGVDGTLTIAGTGAMTEYQKYSMSTSSGGVTKYYASSKAPWNPNASRIQKITVTDGVTTIGTGAFYGCLHVKDISIPASVTGIGDAFSSCSELADVYYGGTNGQWCQISFNGNNNELFAAEVHYASLTELSGSCGEGLTWLLDDTGKLTISGNGTMTDYSTASVAPWYTQNASITEVAIQPGVTGIGEYAFYRCSNLARVTVPESVTRIGKNAFNYCSSLTTIEIPNGMTSIGDYVFANCSSLTSITMPESVTGIGNSAFSNCSSLTSVTIPESVTSIGNGAFYKCDSLTDVYYSSSNTSWAEISIKSNNDSLLKAAIHYASVEELSGTCGDGVTWKLDAQGNMTISGSGTMSDYSSPPNPPWYNYKSDILTVVIENGVTGVGTYAFSNCARLTDVTIPGSVVQVGYNAFSNCSSLTGVVIPEGVTRIGDNAFSKCSSLTSVTIPESVTNLGYSVFSNCTSLTNVVILGSSTSMEYEVFLDCPGLKTAGPIGSGCDIEFGWTTGIPASAFSGCESLTGVIIPEGITSIGASAFAGCALEEVELPSTLTVIEDDVFNGCVGLTEITIPAGLTSIGDYAFYETGLTDVYYDGTPEKWNSIAIGNNNAPLLNAQLHYGGFVASGSCGANLNWILDRRGTLTILGSGKMYDYAEETAPWYAWREQITSAVLESEVSSLGANAFYGCSSMTSVTLPDSVSAIGSGAFANCGQLTTVTIPAAVTDIQPRTFLNCASLNTVTLPTDVKTIGEDAFRGCSGLTGMTIPGTVERVGNGAFRECSSLRSVTFQQGVSEIGDSAFQGCTTLQSVTLPESVKSIGSTAFSNCSSLITVTIPQSVTIIGAQAFSNCSSITSVTIPDGMTALAEGVFASCSKLKTITIPTSVKEIGQGCFSLCSALTTVNYSGTQAQWDAISVREDNEPLQSASIVCALLDYGTCGDTLTWTLSRTGVLTISGTGAMPDYQADSLPPWDSYKSLIKNIVVEEGVMSVGSSAFTGCTSLTGVTIQEGLTVIGNSAFDGCTSLTTATLPPSLKQIGDSAFSGCSQMRDVTVNGTQEQWDAVSVGTDNEGLDRSDIFCSKSETLVANYYDSFVRLRLYHDLDWNWELVVVGDGPMQTSLYNASMQNYRTYISKVTLRYGVTQIVDSAFTSCTNLKEFDLAPTVTSIGQRAFEGCTALTEAVFPHTVTRIGSDAFKNCTGLTHVVVPASVTFTGSGAFDGCTELKTAGPAGGNYDYEFGWTDTIPEKAFSECRNLTSITLPDGLKTIEMDAFFECEQLSEITIPDSVESIGIYAFYRCKALREVLLPEGLKEISGHLFSGCSGLTTVHIPSTVTSVGIMAFSTCEALTDVYYNGTQKQWNAITITPGYNEALVNATKHYALAGLTFNANGGVNPPDYRTAKHGTMIILPGNAPTREGYDLIGWAGTATAEEPEYLPGSGYVMNGETTLYAVWQQKVTYTVTYDANGGSNAPPTQTKTHGEPLALSETKPDRSGYIFLGWATDHLATEAEYQPGDLYTDNADLQLYAVWHMHVPGEAVRENEVAATCTEDGRYDEVVYCSVCGEELSRETKVIPALGHDWDEGTITTKPSCTEPGIRTYTCKHDASHTKTEEIPATGHTAVVDAAIAATCEETGLTEGSHCSVCGEVLTAQEEIPALGHDWDEGTITTKPSCTEPGIRTYTCKHDAGHTKTEEIPAAGHTAVVDAAVAATCEETGLTEGSHCSVCGEVLVAQEVIPALGHDWDEGTVTTKPSCTEPGIRTYTCKHDAAHTKTEEIPATGHTAVVDAAVAATCEETGLTEGSHCSVCGEVLVAQEVIPALGHDWDEGTITTGATCTEPGIRTYTCKHDASHTKTEEVPALGHTPGTPVRENEIPATGTTEGSYDEVVYCTVCEEELSRNHHTIPVEECYTLSDTEVTLAVGKTKQLTVTDSKGNNVEGLTWSSDNETVAVVDQNGKVTANKYGTAVITVSSQTTGYSESCHISTLFWDVADPAKYYFRHVYWAAEMGITKGYDLEYFAPQETCTREQMVTFLWRLAGQPTPATTSSPFPDVRAGSYYYKAVLWAVEKGITNGYSSGPYKGRFGVGLDCTREQAMTFLWRLAGKPEPSTTKNPFKDVKTSDYFCKAVLWASENKIANGYSDGSYGVGVPCLREHMVTFLSRYHSKFG